MRLIKYINEDTDDKIISKILKECKPWFNLIKKTKVKNKLLWRGGSKAKKVKYYEKIKTRKNRKSMDICNSMHILLDKSFEKHYNIKARSQTVFCLQSKNYTVLYSGKPVVIIPVGEFDYIWSKEIYDLYYYIKYNSKMLEIICDDDFLYFEWEKKYGENTEKGQWYYNEINTNTYEKLKAKDYIIKDMMKELNINEIEAHQAFNENELIWKPFISFNMYKELIKNNTYNDIDNLIKNNYIKNKDFKQLMDSKKFRRNEIMLNCDSYYLINQDQDKIINTLENSV